MTADHDRVEEAPVAAGAEPDPALLRDIVERIVRATRPERIVLLGSAADGRMQPHSDLDVLVVKAGTYRRIDVMHAIRRELRGLGVAVDLVVATPEELAEHGSNPALVYASALQSGRELYAQ